MFFPQSNTHIRTLSPGAYIYTIVFCCVCFFLFRKKIKCRHIKVNFSTTVISAIFKGEKRTRGKNIKFKTIDAYLMCCLIPIYTLMWRIYRFRLLVVVPGKFSVWMTPPPPWEAQNHTNTLQFIKHTLSTASHVVNQCCCEASIQLLAIWAVGFKKIKIITSTTTEKTKQPKHTSSIDTNVRVPWLSKCSRQVDETIFFFLFLICDILQ